MTSYSTVPVHLAVTQVTMHLVQHGDLVEIVDSGVDMTTSTVQVNLIDLATSTISQLDN